MDGHVSLHLPGEPDHFRGHSTRSEPIHEKPKLEGERKTPTRLLNKTFQIDIEKSYFFKHLMIGVHYPIMEGDVETDGQLTKFLIVRSVACQAYVKDEPVYFFTNNEGLKEMMKKWKDEDRKSVVVKLAREGRKYVFTETEIAG